MAGLDIKNMQNVPKYLNFPCWEGVKTHFPDQIHLRTFCEFVLDVQSSVFNSVSNFRSNMSKHLYEDEIRLKIGYKNYESILAAAGEHRFDEHQVANFARMLGGNAVDTVHLRANNFGEYEMKQILSDYYCEKMCEMTTEDAIEELTVIIEDYLKIPHVLTAGTSRTGILPASSQEDPNLRRFMDEYSEMVHNKNPDAPGQRFCTQETLSHLATELPTTLSSSPANISSESCNR